MRPQHHHHVETYQHPTLLHALRSRAQLEDQGMTMITADGQELARSWATLIQRAQLRAGWMAQTLGVGPGMSVGLALPNDFRFIESFFACWMLGALPVPLTPPGLFGLGTLLRAQHIIEDAGARYILIAKEDAQDFEQLHAQAALIPIEQEPAQGQWDAALLTLDQIKPSAPALIQYTSGSTSKPRGVTITHANLAANCHEMTINYMFKVNESLVSWLPFYHDMGLIAELLVSTYKGLPFFFMEPTTFLHNPWVWYQCIHDHQCTITHIPNFALAHSIKYIGAELVSQLDLSKMTNIVLGGEPIDAKMVERFVAHFAPAGLRTEIVGGAYGLAEATVGVSRTEPGEGLHVDRVDRRALATGHAKPAPPTQQEHVFELASVGQVIPNHEVIIVDDEGQRLEERQVGQLWVRGPSIMSGYWENQQASLEALHTDSQGHRWLKTGDLGYMAQGSLYVCGRIKELIIIRGKNYHPEDIERCVEQLDEVRAGQSVAFSIPGPDSEQLVILCETQAPQSEHEALRHKVRGLVAQELGLAAKHVDFLPPRSTPKTTSGKRQRRLSRQLWLNHKEQP